MPYTASNFQGYLACDPAVKIGRPTSIDELLALIRSHARVMGVGVGHSWGQQQFCAGDGADAMQVVLTGMPAARLANAAAAAFWDKPNAAVPADFPVRVDAAALVAAVKGGVQTRMLLDYLANYKTAAAPKGYTLPIFPWYIGQTLGGAVATGSHGSDVTEVEVAVANGTLITVMAPSNTHLFKALMVSVGRLGVIAQVKLRLAPNAPVRRTLTRASFADFAAQ
ncbi:hypothetical protein WJX81_000169, partial [Elliptochloris bilobata]